MMFHDNIHRNMKSRTMNMIIVNKNHQNSTQIHLNLPKILRFHLMTRGRQYGPNIGYNGLLEIIHLVIKYHVNVQNIQVSINIIIKIILYWHKEGSSQFE